MTAWVWASAKSALSRSTGAGIGMKNVQERLEVLYGDRARFKIESNPGRGTLNLNRAAGRGAGAGSRGQLVDRSAGKSCSDVKGVTRPT